ncbi:xanthine dehydrogenase family protein subunit M [Bosea caraganae]|uniref:Xanthine dehydrogenase family protein subunit M n=1 Tax=Bosea caraganae TaxID=2763117 RepID=A0A370KZ61_9HYPH|nr:xanthine dehydrogenase family protein subunit M [Bosea caraganae]RDJ20283.1 xanthine dehydrogenase family protein subunit M [Bosea caraganae]RDJ23980.1 xanthine dehydrogenase family protein subunit M [Bosea caraganae]
MIPFTITQAPSTHEAIQAAAAGGRYIAGGTTLIDLMREEVERPDRLIDINALPLKHIRAEGPDLIIGALARMSEVAVHPDTRRLHPVIGEALIEGASPQLRNMASMGGNLLQRVRCPYFRMLDAPCNKRIPGSGCSAIDGLNIGHAILGTSDQCAATHPSDVAVALVALEATMRVQGPQGERTFPVEELYRLPGDTPHLEHTLLPGELIVEIRVPGLSYSRRARYLKVRDRASYEFALIAAAAVIDLDGGVIREARLAVGGAGTRPWRLRAVEQALKGKRLERATLEAAARTAVEGARPLSGNQYKVELLPRTIVRALELAGEIA